MRKNYWKECCLLLIGLIIGFSINYPGSLSVKETTIVKKDTIHDTLYVKAPIPPLSKESVLAELNKQNIPHPNIVLAQALHETGDFKSKLCKTHNNIFGIKKNDKEYRRYSDYTECIRDYKKRISSKYKGGDYYVFLTKLGYAEDPLYIEKLKRRRT